VGDGKMTTTKMNKSAAFREKVLDDFLRLGLIEKDHYEQLKRLTVENIREMGGKLPEGFAGAVTPFLNDRLKEIYNEGRNIAISAYLHKLVNYWRDVRDEGEVPAEFEEAFAKLTRNQQFTFMATFYIDAFQAAHDSIYDCLIPEKED
jgi:hypothetical protein